MKIAVITGASSGMGREMAYLLNDEIPNIEEFWLIGRREERLKEISTLLTKKCRILTWDLEDKESFTKYRELLAEEKPKIVFLINAAGYGKIGKISELSLSDNMGMVKVNTEALTAFSKLSLPYMAEKSRIINFASAAAFLPQAGFAVYAATKSYSLSFSRALNQELHGSGCSVTAVCPGPVKTEFFDIAESTGKIPLYKYVFMADAKKVVKKALRDAVFKKDVSVYGFSMNALLVLAKLPMKWLLDIMRMLNERA